jgi:hypothetical protein
MNTSTQKIELYKVRSFGDLLTDTFTFARQNFKPLLKGLFYIAAPMLLLEVVIGFFFWKNYFGTMLNPARMSSGSGIFATYISMIPQYIMMFIAITFILAVTFSYIKLYREDKEQEITVSMLWQRTKQKIGKLFGATFMLILGCVVVFAVFGLVAYIAGAVLAELVALVLICFLLYFNIRWSFYSFFIVVGDSDIYDSFSGSYNFTRGIFWKTFGFTLVLSFLVGILCYAFVLPGTIVSVVSAIMGAMQGNTNGGFVVSLGSALTGIGTAISHLLYSILFIGQAILYFSEIEKEQGINMQKQIDEIGKN